MNITTRKWWEGKAKSARAACKKTGWQESECWVRVKTANFGWKKAGDSRKRCAT
jgi:hypothetical protein